MELARLLSALVYVHNRKSNKIAFVVLTMAAVVRLKRRLDEEPLEALVLACKRKKTEDAAAKDETPITAILKFAGTVKNQEEDVTAHINKSLRKGSSRNDLRHVADISGKIRAETKQLSQQNRFKVVNCFRALKESEVTESEAGLPSEKNDDKLLTVFDVVSHSEEEEKKSKSENVDSKEKDDVTGDTDYVYDLYYTNMTGSDGLVNLDDLLGVHAYHNSEWDLRNSEDSDESVPGADDEDDSNDENNWRNDYPDSDHSVDEDDMRMAMQDMNIAEDDLSSDDAADDFIFGVTVDPNQVELFGEGYASYKARVLNELEGDEQGAFSREAYDVEQDEDADEDPVLRFM